MRAVRVILGSAFFLFLVPWFSVQVLPASWAVIGTVWAAFLFWLAFRRPKRRWGALWFNLGVVLLALAAVELYLHLRPLGQAAPRRGAHTGYMRKDADLGYGLVPGSRKTIEYWWGTEKIVEASYTIDEHGCRMARTGIASSAPLAWFFGGSFMFGRGLEDLETLPNRIAELSGDRIAPRNFALGGYGPHQMLTLLETGRAEAADARPPSHAFYLAIPDHVRRVAGRAPWDQESARYRLGPDGAVHREGRFSDTRSAFERRILKWLAASNLFALARKQAPAPEHFELMAAIVRTSRDRISARWPDCRFHVLLWDDPLAGADRTAAALEAEGIACHRVSAMVPGFREDPLPFVIDEHDGHPNAGAVRQMAAWVVAEVLEGS